MKVKLTENYNNGNKEATQEEQREQERDEAMLHEETREERVMECCNITCEDGNSDLTQPKTGVNM